MKNMVGHLDLLIYLYKNMSFMTSTRCFIAFCDSKNIKIKMYIGNFKKVFKYAILDMNLKSVTFETSLTEFVDPKNIRMDTNIIAFFIISA